MNPVDRWVRPGIRDLAAYAVHDAAGMIKLDAMENPYGWPAEMIEAWFETLKGIALNRYPDAAAKPLRDTLQAYMGLPAQYPALLGNGSDELIQLLMLLVGGQGRTVMAPEPSFVMYRMIALGTSTAFEAVPLDAEFDLDVDAMCARIDAVDPALIFLASPNNPTGNAFSAERIAAIIERSSGLVVLDEAYAPFCDQPVGPDLLGHPRVVVMRTLSKLGLAGLRLGLLTGPGEWVSELDKLRLPYNINSLTQATASFAINYGDVIAAQAKRIVDDRTALRDQLDRIDAVTCWPSEANFMMFRVPGGSAGSVHDSLKRAGILIKRLDGSHPRLTDCLRVTVGTAAENERFVAALRTALESIG